MEPSIHSNHRRRMRDRFASHGMDVFYDHEILEMLLYSTISRADTNAIAHDLLARCGSLPAVFDAPDEILLSVKGMGAHSVQFLRFIRGLMHRYEEESRQALACAPVMNRDHDVFTFFTNKLTDANEEVAMMACLDNCFRVLCWRRLPRHEDKLFTARDIADYALQSNASMVALFVNRDAHYRENFDRIRCEDQTLQAILEQISIRFPYNLFVKGNSVIQHMNFYRPGNLGKLCAPVSQEDMP